jgi:cyclic pyranopterin phosphate synthase
MAKLSHTDSDGKANMVDVAAKGDTERIAIAKCRVAMAPETHALIIDGKIEKGDVLSVARIAGIMAGKKTSDLIPLCHPLALSRVSIDIEPIEGEPAFEITGSAKVTGKTGVEMEALTAASIAALTIYDMAKAVDRGIRITDLRLVHKSGGKSGVFDAAE